MVNVLIEMRKDVISPRRRPSLMPCGLNNPGNLCYRNPVITALLNTPRFMSFLNTHSRRMRTYLGTWDVNHYLPTSLYHLSLAYWKRIGFTPCHPRCIPACRHKDNKSASATTKKYEHARRVKRETHDRRTFVNPQSVKLANEIY
ncbi:hypothetical protein SEUCBS139899_007990 [Sporothrix eucalyptigena]